MASGRVFASIHSVSARTTVIGVFAKRGFVQLVVTLENLLLDFGAERRKTVRKAGVFGTRRALEDKVVARCEKSREPLD